MIISQKVWERMLNSAENALLSYRRATNERLSIYGCSLGEYKAVRRAMLVAYKRARGIRFVPDPLATQIGEAAEAFADFPAWNREWIP